MDMNDNNAFINSGALAYYNRHYTSLSMDNVYGDKRLLMADPINHVLEGVHMFNNQAETPIALVDSASTAGMALDYIYADTLINPDAAVMMVSSRTTGIVGLASSNLAPDGSTVSQIDTSFTSMFNAVAPVGGVLVKKGNLTELWVADNGQNKLLRLSLYNYNITPTLPAGLSFNAVTGVIEGTPKVITAPQTYTLTVYYGLGGFGSSTSTFTLGVTPSGGVSNTTGTANSNANQTDGTTKNYIDDQNCTQLVVITDFTGGTSPGETRVTQTVASTGAVTVGNKNFVRRVTSVQAQQTENINAQIKFFYTYQDVQAFNTAHPADALTNDTNVVTNPSRTMITTMLHMHETFDTTNSVWRNVPTFYQNMFASWKPTQQVWELNVPVTKFSGFYLGNPNVATGFNCSNSAKDTIVANDYYVWNYPDSLFTSGDYVDTLINHTGCDSIVQLHLTINITTGLNEAALNSGISVFPNPSNGVFNIRFNNAVIMPSKVRVISVLGTEVMNKTITSSDSIDLSSLIKVAFIF
ncbi:MAG: putative Ig domain-containing protein [Bacteroidetes bacterium]|nr:putative Ig domain-containing protein [Bacteroidota bacterium]